MSRPVVDVVAAVLSRDGDVPFRGGAVLACRRRAERAAGGLWEFPGGKVEAGEAPADALEREIREELGIPIAVGRMLRDDTTDVGDRGIRLRCFAARLVDAAPLASTDHDRLEWIAPAHLGRLEWAAPDLPMVRELLTGTLAV